MDRISRLKQPELLTNRLILRSLEPADARLVFLLRSETDASRFVDRPVMSGIEDGLRFIRRISISISEGDCMYWALVPKNQLDLIGTICLWNWEPKSKQAEISFELLEAWQGQGYMQEALHRVLDYAFIPFICYSCGCSQIPGISRPERLHLHPGIAGRHCEIFNSEHILLLQERAT